MITRLGKRKAFPLKIIQIVENARFFAWFHPEKENHKSGVGKFPPLITLILTDFTEGISRDSIHLLIECVFLSNLFKISSISGISGYRLSFLVYSFVEVSRLGISHLRTWTLHVRISPFQLVTHTADGQQMTRRRGIFLQFRPQCSDEIIHRPRAWIRVVAPDHVEKHFAAYGLSRF